MDGIGFDDYLYLGVQYRYTLGIGLDHTDDYLYLEVLFHYTGSVNMSKRKLVEQSQKGGIRGMNARHNWKPFCTA